MADDVTLKKNRENVEPVHRTVPSNCPAKIMAKFHWVLFELLDRPLTSIFHLCHRISTWFIFPPDPCYLRCDRKSPKLNSLSEFWTPFRVALGVCRKDLLANQLHPRVTCLCVRTLRTSPAALWNHSSIRRQNMAPLLQIPAAAEPHVEQRRCSKWITTRAAAGRRWSCPVKAHTSVDITVALSWKIRLPQRSANRC